MNCRLAKGPASGFSLIELVIVAAVLSILAMVALPTGKYVAKRNKEIEFRSALRELRFAIDEYKRYSDAGLIPADLGADGYPAELEELYEGVELVGQAGRTAKFLRRLPGRPDDRGDRMGSAQLSGRLRLGQLGG